MVWATFSGHGKGLYEVLYTGVFERGTIYL
jgi:hypothetical protein